MVSGQCVGRGRFLILGSFAFSALYCGKQNHPRTSALSAVEIVGRSKLRRRPAFLVLWRSLCSFAARGLAGRRSVLLGLRPATSTLRSVGLERCAPSISIAISIAIWICLCHALREQDVPAALRNRRKLSHAEARRRGVFLGCMSLCDSAALVSEANGRAAFWSALRAVLGSFAVSAFFGGKRIGGRTAFNLGFALRHLRFAPSDWSAVLRRFR